ncbi:MAG: D-alanyl-D-alanine carboxypeptidase [Alphaproteobacteria bacterium]|nr:D-alanyl-D-alanine carboxypeptidase [Alphaproteobacteria bacterium]
MVPASASILRRARARLAVVAVLAVACAAAPLSALAQNTETVAPRAILIEYATGQVLLTKNVDDPVPPASMSKMMLLYMVFERLAEGKLSLDDTFPVSEKAWRMGGSKMFVRVSTRVSVRDLLHGIIVQSGNDACIVLAEGLGGTEASFADRMTERGRELGLTNSVFKNSSGWPEEGHVMSVRDIALLAMRIIHDFPQYYPFFSETSFTYNDIRQTNRNPLLFSYPGTDGLKTGHSEEAGYGLAASAVRNGRRMVLVATGMTNEDQRARETERLMDWGFREFGNYDFFKAGDVVAEAPVWLGGKATVPLVLNQNLTVTMSRNARRKMTVKAVYDGPIPAGIRQGQQLATLRIEAPDMQPIQLPLYAGTDVDRLGLFGRLGAAVNYLVWGGGETVAAN